MVSASARHYLASAENVTVRAKAASSQGHRQPQTLTQKHKVTTAQDISVCPSWQALPNLDGKDVSVHFMIHSAWTYDIYHNEASLAKSDKYVPLLALGNRDRDILSSDFCDGHVRLTTSVYLTRPENNCGERSELQRVLRRQATDTRWKLPTASLRKMHQKRMLHPREPRKAPDPATEIQNQKTRWRERLELERLSLWSASPTPFPTSWMILPKLYHPGKLNH